MHWTLFFSFLMWRTVIMNIRSLIVETAVFNSWRQPVDAYLSGGSSISIDGIQIIYIYIFYFSTTNIIDDSKTFYCPSVPSYKETHKVSTVSHWLGSLYLENWKSWLFQITKAYPLSQSRRWNLEGKTFTKAQFDLSHEGVWSW